MKKEKAEKIYCLMNGIRECKNKLDVFHFNILTHFEAMFEYGSVKISDYDLLEIINNVIEEFYEKELKRLEKELNEN
jgi:hypothetical protein